jgi:hypothetical protein
VRSLDRHSRPTPRARGAAALLALLIWAAAACAHLTPPPEIALRVDCEAPDATVWVDDVLVGSAAAWKAGDRHIRAGFHRVEVRAPGFYSAFQEIDLPNGGPAVVVARLHETLD